MRIVSEIEPIKITYKAVCFSGQTPSLHAEIKKKFLAAQAIFNVETKKATRKLQTLLIKKNKMQAPQKITCKIPG